MEKNSDTLINIQGNIIDSCTTILKQNSIIVYPSNEETHNDTFFYVKELLSSTDCYSIGKTIFEVYGPSYGYSVEIKETNVSISGYDLSPDNQAKLRNLWKETDNMSYKQKTLRTKIANTERMHKLINTTYYLQNIINKTK